MREWDVREVRGVFVCLRRVLYCCAAVWFGEFLAAAVCRCFLYGKGVGSCHCRCPVLVLVLVAGCSPPSASISIAMSCAWFLVSSSVSKLKLLVKILVQGMTRN